MSGVGRSPRDTTVIDLRQGGGVSHGDCQVPSHELDQRLLEVRGPLVRIDLPSDICEPNLVGVSHDNVLIVHLFISIVEVADARLVVMYCDRSDPVSRHGVGILEPVTRGSYQSGQLTPRRSEIPLARSEQQVPIGIVDTDRSVRVRRPVIQGGDLVTPYEHQGFVDNPSSGLGHFFFLPSWISWGMVSSANHQSSLMRAIMVT